MPFLVLTPAAYLDKPAYMVKICLTYSVLYEKVNRFFGYFPNKMLFYFVVKKLTANLYPCVLL